MSLRSSLRNVRREAYEFAGNGGYYSPEQHLDAPHLRPRGSHPAGCLRHRGKRA